MNSITIEEAQELRKVGYYIVVNSTWKKVLLVTKVEEEAYLLKNNHQKKNKVARVYSPLNKV